MTISVESLRGALEATGITPAVASGSRSNEPGFAARLDRLVEDVDMQVQTADSQVRKLSVDNAQSLHGVMIALENARLEFGLMVQVRNRLVEAYQDVLRMQI